METVQEASYRISSRVDPEPPKITEKILLIIIFILGFCLRLYHLGAPPLDFEPEREYHSYIVARSYFLQNSASVPEWRIEVSKQNAQQEYFVEPPILEHLASAIYRLIGREEFWIPKLFSVIFWFIGGFVLLNIVRDSFGYEGAIFACGYYFLNPFAISASKTFMPNPLMILLMLFALMFIIKYYNNSTMSTFLISVVFTGAAGIIKPFSLIPLFAVFLLVGIQSYQSNFKKWLHQTFLFLVLVIVVMSPYYLWSLLTNTFLSTYAGRSFIPKLWFRPFYWGGWFDLIRNTTGYIPFVLGLAGILIAQNKKYRAVLIGLWLGYLIFGLIFTYHIHTHDYYHLMLTPIIALSLAPFGSMLMKSIKLQNHQQFNDWILAAIVAFVCAASVHETRARWKNVVETIHSEVSKAVEIGEAVHHSSKTLSLASYYAKPLKYHAEITGTSWPYRFDFLASERLGRKTDGAIAILNQIQTKYSPEYFIVADLDEFNAQPELKQHLYNTYEVYKQTDQYIIFSLKKRP
jgi:4-amino-4-deoxy-L-arabinose transferase-like glycosyltransferase